MNKKGTRKKNNNTNKRSHKKSKTIKKKGGFAFRNNPLANILKELKESEKELVRVYKYYMLFTDKFLKIYSEHINTLQSLDLYVPGTNTFENTFKNVLFPKHIKNNVDIDLGIPLFINQYMVSNYADPTAIKTEHLNQQFKYILSEEFTVSDRYLINTFEIKVVDKESVTISIYDDNNNLFEASCPHENLILDYASLQQILSDTIDNIRNKVTSDKVPNDPNEKLFFPQEFTPSAPIPGLTPAAQPIPSPIGMTPTPMLPPKKTTKKSKKSNILSSNLNQAQLAPVLDTYQSNDEILAKILELEPNVQIESKNSSKKK
mgnify:CR=1 FL=1